VRLWLRLRPSPSGRSSRWYFGIRYNCDSFDVVRWSAAGLVHHRSTVVVGGADDSDQEEAVQRETTQRFLEMR